MSISGSSHSKFEGSLPSGEDHRIHNTLKKIKSFLKNNFLFPSPCTH